MRTNFFIFILIIAICFFPIKILGFFATPNEHVKSMSFGLQNDEINIKKPVIFLELGNAPENEFLQPAAFSININNPTDMPWLIFLSAVLTVIIIFILLKFKKML